MDPIARAKNAFFGCLAASVAVLVFVDLYLGPTALAVTSAPDGGASASAELPPLPTPMPVPPTPASAAASTTPPEREPPPVVLVEDAGGRISGVVATFEFEQANADLAALQTLAKQMHADLSAEIVLEGHSDPSGNEYKNLSLSLDRANWAADRLVEYGINRMRIRTVGLGSARPIVDVDGDAGAVNRRVEVRWVLRSPDGGGR